jgi:hypothetical protein
MIAKPEPDQYTFTQNYTCKGTRTSAFIIKGRLRFGERYLQEKKDLHPMICSQYGY